MTDLAHSLVVDWHQYPGGNAPEPHKGRALGDMPHGFYMARGTKWPVFIGPFTTAADAAGYWKIAGNTTDRLVWNGPDHVAAMPFDKKGQ